MHAAKGQIRDLLWVHKVGHECLPGRPLPFAPFVFGLPFVLVFVFAFTSFCACLCLSALALLGIFLHGFLRPCLFLPYPPPLPSALPLFLKLPGGRALIAT